ncbi:MAG: hypothetical protein ACK515_24540 [bacterium]|jgi:hypothetical protein|nr:hypothetical protein [Betaproteobacteria bacterium]
MSLETMSFILGGILLGAGLFGGGLEIKELKLPQIGPVARAMSALVGIAFVALAVFLNPKPEPVPAPAPAPQPAATPPAVPAPHARREVVSFADPMQGDLRLDACLKWGELCGEPAASAWCRARGLSKALEFPIVNVGERGIATRLIGTDQVCRQVFCASFSVITCEK